MDGRTQTQPGQQPGAVKGGSAGTDEVARLWVGLEHQQEVLGPIAGELMALLHPGVKGYNDPFSPETDVTSRG